METFASTQVGTLQLFCRAVEQGSFTGAAEAAGLTPAAVSRAVARLEQRLGVKLFRRTTRKVAPTDDGHLYYEQCRQALAQIEEAERALTGSQSAPRGLLRVSAPTTYAHYRLLPLVAGYGARYPQVEIELNVSNRNIDFIDEGYDIAVRLGVPADSRLVARKLEDASVGLFASPAYLKAHGTPKTLDDLERHRCIPFIMPSTGRTLPWLFRQRGQEIERTPRAAMRVSDDVLGCVTLARAGAGITQSYHFIVQGWLASGELVEVLPRLGGRSRPFSILYPRNRHMSARVRSFVDHVLAGCCGRPKTEPLLRSVPT
jgi:DNA-binding transcriptional LysR family regulator